MFGYLLRNCPTNAFLLILVKELILKSATVEKSVKDLINKFLSVIEQPELQAHLYDWLDPVKAVKPIGSTSRLLTSADAGIYFSIIILL